MHTAPPAPHDNGTPGAKKGLALTALIVGIVAFLTGLLPVVGIVLGLIAIAFGIIALVKKQAKVLAVIGLALGVIAVIASIIATVLAGAVTNAIMEEVEQQSSSTTAPSEEATAPEDDDTTIGELNALGSTLYAQDWDVTVWAFTPDVSAEVSAASPSNPPASAGYQYVVFEIESGYYGDGEGSTSDIKLDYVTADGEVISSEDHTLQGITPAFGGATVPADASHAGLVLFTVPSTLDGALRVTPSENTEPVFFGLS